MKTAFRILVLGASSISLAMGIPRTWAGDPTPPASTPSGAAAAAAQTPPQQTRPALPEDVQKKIMRLRTQREAYLAGQKLLLKDWKSLSADERKQLREEMKQNQQEFMADQRALRQEIRDRLEEMRTEFRNSRSQILDEAKEKTKDRQSRRGTD
jgi:hypothetical protein